MKAIITDGKFYLQRFNLKRLKFKTFRVTARGAVQHRRSKLEIVYDNVFSRG